jgi:pimeloyl-ACP methyl ester carboxylesterase
MRSFSHLCRRTWRGLSSAAAGLAFPLGGWWLGTRYRIAAPARLAHGLAIVLPGIEGWGPLNWSIARGIEDGGFPGAILVHDWTTGVWPLFAFHLRARSRNRRCAAAVASLIVKYRKEFADGPVYLVGHSGGAAIAVWTLKALPESQLVASTVLLAPALSPTYDLTSALKRVMDTIYNFWSPLDLFYLAAGTLLFGTADGRHSLSAGCRGFTLPVAECDTARSYSQRLEQRRYCPRMLTRFHWGGHFGWANRVFVADQVTPLLSKAEMSAS